jgi:hypothetical protein
MAGLGAKTLVSGVRLYQRFISPLKPPTCRFYPTCSCYALEALERHGAIGGSLLSLWRILRCNPFNPGGIDKVPQKIRWNPLAGYPKERL